MFSQIADSSARVASQDHLLRAVRFDELNTDLGEEVETQVPSSNSALELLSQGCSCSRGTDFRDTGPR